MKIIFLLLFRNVPANYKVLFLHGGGRAAFSAVALNLMGKTGVADYMETGIRFVIQAVLVIDD